MFTIVQFLVDSASSVYVARQFKYFFSTIVQYSFQTVSKNLEQISADSSYYTFRIVMSLNANRVECEESGKFKC